MFRKVSINLIEEAALKVVSKVHTEQIILFGSYAYGKPNIDSDVDLIPAPFPLILLFDQNRNSKAVSNKAISFYKTLWSMGGFYMNGKIVKEWVSKADFPSRMI